MNFNCPIDNSKLTEKFFSLKNFPLQTTPINKKKLQSLISKFGKKKLFVNLNYFYCKNCGHISLANPPKQKIMNYLYEKFYNYPSPLLKQFIPDRDNSFLKVFFKKFHKFTFNPKNKNLLEIACYDGYILYNLRRFYNVYGVDPSKGALIGQKFGLDIKRKFFNYKNFKKEKGKYNIIISRHFIEHLKDPISFLKTCNSILSENSFIIIEVPDIKHFIKNGLVDVFSPQHIQCFSKSTLKNILSKSGFRVKKTVEINGNLIAVAKKSKKINLKKQNVNINLIKNYKDKFRNLELEIKKKIKQSNYRNIILWGAGSFCSSFLSTFDINFDDVKYVVDSDLKKKKLKFLNSKIKIISPNNAVKLKPDLIIITSYYSMNIIKSIKKMKFNADILKIFPQFQCIKKI